MTDYEKQLIETIALQEDYIGKLVAENKELRKINNIISLSESKAISLFMAYEEKFKEMQIDVSDIFQAIMNDKK